MPFQVDWSLVVGISSVVIALCALITTIKHGTHTKKHNKLSVTPNLDTWTHTQDDKRVILYLLNNGIGPAKIKSYNFSLDGEVIEGTGSVLIEDLAEKIFPDTPHKVINSSFLAIDFMMIEKTKVTIADVVFTGKSLPAKTKVEESFNRIDLTIKYESIYGEPFELSTKDRR